MREEYENENRRSHEYTPRKKSSGAGTALMLILLALIFIIGPFVAPINMSSVAQVICLGFGVILLIVGAIILVITRLYVKTGANEAFVKTGMGGRKAIIDGGAVVIPVIHEMVPVSLETMKLQVKRDGKEALLTSDFLRAIVYAEFFIRVEKDEADVLQAATSLGSRCGDAGAVKSLVEEKLVSALRTVAARTTLHDLNSKRDEFAQAVQEIVQGDLKPNGLKLESVTISQLDQAPPDTEMADTNVFDAQGLKKVAEITQQAKVARRTIEVQAEQDIKEKEVKKDQYIYNQEIIQAKASAEKDRDIKNAQAEAESLAAKFKAEQDKLAGIARVENDQLVKVAEVKKNEAIEVAGKLKEQAVQTAEIAKEKSVQVATVEKERTVQTAGVEKQQAVEIATREQQIAIAQAEQRRAAAEADRVAAETERTRKEQEKLNVQQEAEATRAKTVAVINKEASAKQEQIEKNMSADISAYGVMKQAEAEQQAAEKQAKARLTKAEAEQKALTLEAEGKTALGMVPVKVSRGQAEVEQFNVTVLEAKLKAQTANEKMAFDLEVAKTQIAAEKDVKIAMANACGTMLSKANMTIYGDPATVNQLVKQFFDGQAIGNFIGGIAANTPSEVKDLVSGGIKGIAELASGAVKKLLNKDIDPEVFEKSIKEEAAARAAGSKSAQA